MGKSDGGIYVGFTVKRIEPYSEAVFHPQVRTEGRLRKTKTRIRPECAVKGQVQGRGKTHAPVYDRVEPKGILHSEGNSKRRGPRIGGSFLLRNGLQRQEYNGENQAQILHMCSFD